MTPKNRTLEGKHRRVMGGQKSSKKVGHHLWMIPNVRRNLIKAPSKSSVSSNQK